MAAALAPQSTPLAPTSVSNILAGEPERQKESKEKQDAYTAKVESINKQEGDVPLPKFENVPPPVAKPSDPNQAWGSSAMLLAGIGSLFTRRPIVTAMNAASQVFNAIHQKDMAAANQAFQSWKVASENAQKQFDFEMKSRDAILKKYENDKESAKAELDAFYKSQSDQTASKNLEVHGLEGDAHMANERSRLGIEYSKAAQDLQIKGREIGILAGFDKARAAMADAQKSKDPAKIADAKQMMVDVQNEAKDYAAAKGKPSAGELSDETLNDMADQALAGDKSVLQGLGYGNTGAANRAALRDKMSEKMRAQGMSGSDLAAKNAEFFGTTAGERTLGTTAARIGLGAAEMETLIPLVQSASKDLPRSNYPTMNALVQAAQAQTGNPKLRNLAVRLQGLKSAYSQVLTRGGVPTDSARAATDELFATKDPQAVLDTVLDAMKQETGAIRAAPGMVQKEMRDRLTGKSTPSGSKILKYDAQGNLVP